MTIFLAPPETPPTRSFANGAAGLGEIWSASREALLLVENSNAAFEALSRAYDERINELHAVTGQRLENPLIAATEARRQAEIERPFVPGLSVSSLTGERPAPKTTAELYLERREAFDRDLAEAVTRIPDRTVADRMMRSIEGEAAQLARAADERLGRLMESRDGLSKWAALLGGGAVGSFNDPVTIMSLAAGGGPGAARTVAGRILATAGREAIINAGTEAAIQPLVQDWRRRIGLPAGFEEGLKNVAFAGAFGGLFGAGGQAGAELFSRTIGRTRAAEALEQASPDSVAGQLARNDGLAVRESLAEIRPALAPEARGALDAGDRLAHADSQRPAAANAERHDAAVAAADRAVAGREAEVWPGFEPDAAQLDRVVRSVAGEAVTAATAETRVLARFLAKLGGIRDVSGELRQIGATDVMRRGLVRKDGLPPDTAREAAAEAGFFDHIYGTPDEAVAKSTVNDLYDALDTEIRGATRTGPAGPEAQLAGLEQTVDDIARLAGPGLSDELLEAATRLAIGEELDAGDALERVLVRAELEKPASYVRSETQPGWTQAELEEAAKNRGAVPAADGLDDPGKFDNLPDWSRDSTADISASPSTLDELYARAPERQVELEALGHRIASDNGVEFRSAGIKDRGEAERKVARKSYRDISELTDVVRGGFVVDGPDKADEVVAALNGELDTLDEGWKRSPAGYVDRKVLLRFADGTIGEIQIWQPDMLAAKTRQGHALYRKARAAAPGSDEARQAIAKMQEVYSAAAAEAGSAWRALIEPASSAPKPGSNRARQSASESSAPSWKTSQKSTGSQDAPGDVTANAASSSRTAGRRSQSTNFIGDTSGANIGASGANASWPRELAEADPKTVIPWENGEASVKDVTEAIRHRQGVAALVEACKV